MEENTPTTPAAMTGPEFETALHQFKDFQAERAKHVGPVFSTGGVPAIWFDQLFNKDAFVPTGTVNCENALRVGKTHNGLDVVVIANGNNTGDLVVPAGSTITMSFLHSDALDGSFEDVGPTICVTAPTGGKKVRPGGTVARFAIGDFTKPWLMVKVAFSGSITGGKVDCGLSYTPR